MGYTQNDPFREYSVGLQKYGTPYYLTTEERDLLYKIDMGKDKGLTQAHDIFIFQCYIGCRISDLLSFTENNIVTTDNGVFSTIRTEHVKSLIPNAENGPLSHFIY